MARRIEDSCSYDDLIYVLSHDLRAPARALRQYIMLLQEDGKAELTGDAKRFMSRMTTVLDRMDGRLDALLTLSRFSRPRGNLEDVALGPIVSAAADRLGLVVTVQETPAVHADRGRLQWLIDELLDNISHHAGDDVRVEFSHDGELFWIKDDGAGVPEHLLDQVFMVYRPVPHPNTPRLGMGLSCASRIVRSLGGRMGLECPDDKGTHLYFALPLADAASVR